MSDVFMVIGFMLAAYSIIANDSIQTLGTFLSSNAKRPWWTLWLWIASILVVTVLWGWYSTNGDPSFGRLDKPSLVHPEMFNWLYVIPPLVLVMLTRSGVPVSTSFLVLTAFSSLTALQMGESGVAPADLLKKMLTKSVVGYILAFALGILFYSLVVTSFEKKFLSDEQGRENPNPAWFLFQWLSTGFLWSMWLIQDLANVFVYLPRKLPFWVVAASLVGMVLLLAALIRGRGGRIQQVVTEKTNTIDLRSATLIDLFYGLVLLFFKFDYIPDLFESQGWAVPWPTRMPMSTTWVFLGLLAGREAGIWLRIRQQSGRKLQGIVFKDLFKVILGTVVSMIVAFSLPAMATMAGYGPAEEGFPGIEQPADPSPVPDANLPEDAQTP